VKLFILASSFLLISGCAVTGNEFSEPESAKTWTAAQHKNIQLLGAESLKNWWTHFKDPALNKLINRMLENSPERHIAEARIAEARGIRRSTRSSLFPQIGASAQESREDFGFTGPDNFSDARFDASFEVDVFGRNRKNLRAADAKILALESEFHNTTLSLIAEISRSYIDYRGFAKQTLIAQKNLNSQQKTLELIRSQKAHGEATQLDVERAENLVNTTTSSIPEFQRFSDNARLGLSILTGDLPENLSSMFSASEDIPGANIKPILLAPSQVLSLRPDIQAASANLSASTSLVNASIAELWPTFTLSGFFGTSEGAFSPASTVWNLSLGTAVNIIDFGRIEGRIDGAKAREKIAYEQYRLTIIKAVTEIETALSDYAYIDEQRLSLKKAYNNADNALVLSQDLYREGEISFLDVLDAQRTVNAADSALVSSEVAQVESLIRLYKGLGVY
jgi:NodT family efflux transporter outer membrane factor (OMF) lipoprotein